MLRQKHSGASSIFWTILDALIATKPKADDGLGPQLTLRFDQIVAANGRQGLLARVYLGRDLAYLDAIDPAWTDEKLMPRFSWEHPEALAMWRSYSQAPNVGSARLFNALKPAMLEAFERTNLSDREFEGLVHKLLSVGLWHQRSQAPDYRLANLEIKNRFDGRPTCRTSLCVVEFMAHDGRRKWRACGQGNSLAANHWPL